MKKDIQVIEIKKIIVTVAGVTLELTPDEVIKLRDALNELTGQCNGCRYPGYPYPIIDPLPTVGTEIHIPPVTATDISIYKQGSSSKPITTWNIPSAENKAK